jgi:FtsH-binding integral membrane protein
MSKNVITDLSSEMPSGQVPPGQHRFRGVMRIPLLRWKMQVTVQSPDRSPAAVAAGWLGVAVAGLAPPAVLALAARIAQLSWWSIPAAAAVSAVLVVGQTALMLWYQCRIRNQDLTVTEGDPGDRADPLLEHQQVHGFELGTRQVTMAELEARSSPWSPPGLSMAFLTLIVSGLLPAAAFVGVAALIPGAVAAAVISAAAVFTVTVVGGVITMIKVEQRTRPSRPDRPHQQPKP